MRFGFLLSQHCSGRMQYSSGTGAKCQIIRLHYRHCGSERSVAVRRGTPYRYGGMSRRGVDCSGFVVVTMRDKFDLQLPRDTREQSKIGTRIDKDELLPEIWFSLKPVRAKVVYMLVFTIQIMSLFMPLPVVA